MTNDDKIEQLFEQRVEIMGKIIDTLRDNGIEVVTPYDVENFFDDYGSHSNMMRSGRFANMDKQND